jgi:tetratricopeptide (TPR) repeat protein
VELFGEDDPDVQTTRVVLAQSLGFQAKNQEARELLERVLENRSERLGPDHPATIVALGSLGSALDDVGELAESEAMLREALERARRVFGPDNQQTLSLLNNLSISLAGVGKLDEAEEVLRDCLARRQRVFGAEHVETLNTVNHLVTFLWDRERIDEVAELIPGLLETCLGVLGESHRETLRARYSAALLFGRQHRQREAAEQFAAIVARDREILRPDDPQLSRELYNWAATLQNSGDNAAAEPILRDLLRLIDEHALGYLEFVPAARNALAKVLEEKGEHEEADQLFRRALAERRRRFPGPHEETCYSLSDWGEAMLERGDPDGAEPLFVELVQMQERLQPADGWRLASARYLSLLLFSSLLSFRTGPARGRGPRLPA